MAATDTPGGGGGEAGGGRGAGTTGLDPAAGRVGPPDPGCSAADCPVLPVPSPTPHQPQGAPSPKHPCLHFFITWIWALEGAAPGCAPCGCRRQCGARVFPQ